MAQKKQKTQEQETFALANEPVDMQISVHMRNMFATYGEDKVRASLGELFGMKSKAKRASKKVG